MALNILLASFTDLGSEELYSKALVRRLNYNSSLASHDIGFLLSDVLVLCHNVSRSS